MEFLRTTAQKMIEKQSLQVDLARKDFYPDFNVQYMWQRTDPTQFRAYYMLTVGVRVPIYRSRKQKPELAQAQSEELRARSEFGAQSQQLASELRSQYVAALQTAELLKIHREGLAPEARASFQSRLAAYQSNKQDFQPVLTAFLDVLHLGETKLFKELFVGFNAQYDKLNDELNGIVFGPTERGLSEQERELVFSYFNLCAEELKSISSIRLDTSTMMCGGHGVAV